MDQLPAFGKAIQNIVLPTFKTYAPLVSKNASFIKSAKKETFTYGPHERQQLDVYSPPKSALINGRKPVLLFEYGGGLIQGSKALPAFPDELVHANVGAFFALKCGYTVVIADYRLVFQHDAKFPSGGEDIALAVQWIMENQPGPGEEPIDLFIMGNSAGGIHLSTFLLHPDFAETRQKITSLNASTRLRGAVLLSVPFTFGEAHESRAKVLNTYYSDYHTECPLGSLKSARQSQESQGKGEPFDFIAAGVRVLVLNGELDPDDEIIVPRDDFLKEWLGMDDLASRYALAVDWMPRHNHISPVCALGTGIEEEEAWGHQVAAFCDNIRKFKAG